MELTDKQFVLTYPTADKSKAQANCRIIGMEMKMLSRINGMNECFYLQGPKIDACCKTPHKSAYFLFLEVLLQELITENISF